MSGDLVLVVRRTIAAPAARLFDAWTRPELLLQWWGPRPVTCCAAEVDLRVGGAYRIGNAMPDGRVVWIAGEFEIVEPPHRLVYTWMMGDAAATRVTVRFEAHAGGADTDVIVVHEQIESEQTRAGHEQGWIGCLAGLAGLAGLAAPG